MPSSEKEYSITVGADVTEYTVCILYMQVAGPGTYTYKQKPDINRRLVFSTKIQVTFGTEELLAKLVRVRCWFIYIFLFYFYIISLWFHG